MQLLIAILAIASGASALSRAPTFTLNLDLQPEQRWSGAPSLIVATHGWENSFGLTLAMYEPFLAAVPQAVLTALTNNFRKQFPTNFREMRGMVREFAKLGHSEFNMTMMIALAHFYEFAHATDLSETISPSLRRSCCGILALPLDHSKEIIHGRNMDESPYAGRNCSLHIVAIRNNATVYEAFDWTWMTTGFLTSSSYDGVTTEENWRDYGNYTVMQIVERLLQPGTIPTQLLQRVVQERPHRRFEDTLNFINTAQLAAPLYIIMSGTGRRGAVLTISFNASENVVESIDDNSDSWFMVQTNYDRWLPDPPTDPRRTVAENALRTIGLKSGGSNLGVWMALSTYPVHNGGTMYTTLMSAGNREIEGFVRNIIHNPNE